MESNEQTELTSKIERDSSKENRFDSYGVGLGGQGIEQKGKRAHGHGQQCGDCGREGVGTRMVNGNGKIQ